MPVARTLAEEIAANTSAVSVTLSRRLLWSMLGEPTPWEAHRLDSRAISALGQGPDVTEGVESFLEKRPPRFSARVADYLGVVPEWPARPADLG
jgi:enoyl-CoA hydratase/carnithine racemase